MLYGVETDEGVQPHFPAVGGTDAVHFSGLTGPNGQCGIARSALSCTNNGFFAFAGWFKTNWYPATGTAFPNIFMIDSHTDSVPNFHRNGTTQWEEDVGAGAHSGTVNIGASDSLTYLPANDTQWRHIIAACDVNHANPGKLMKIYVNDIDATANLTGTSSAYTFTMNGKDFWLGDDGFGDSWVGDVYDFSLWPGVNLLTAGDISLTTRRLFNDGSGHPVAPSVSIAALGSPALMLTGGVSGFLANTLGASGTLTVPAGYDTPVNAATHP